MDYLIEENILSEFNEPILSYENDEINSLTYKIIGAAMNVYNNLGRGFLEAVYKDCLCIEFDKQKINYQKEKKFEITYEGIKIPHFYCTDFIIEDKLILEIKAQNLIIEENVKQTINYLAVSKCKIGLLINFGDNSLKYKRVILTK